MQPTAHPVTRARALWQGFWDVGSARSPSRSSVCSRDEGPASALGQGSAALSSPSLVLRTTFYVVLWSSVAWPLPLCAVSYGQSLWCWT